MIKLGKPAWLVLPSIIFLGLFAGLLTLHPAHAGRVYASYGGVYVFVSLLWLWLFEKQTPDVWDLSGTLLILVGAGLIIFGKHAVS